MLAIEIRLQTQIQKKFADGSPINLLRVFKIFSARIHSKINNLQPENSLNTSNSMNRYQSSQSIKPINQHRLTFVV